MDAFLGKKNKTVVKDLFQFKLGHFFLFIFLMETRNGTEDETSNCSWVPQIKYKKGKISAK